MRGTYVKFEAYDVFSVSQGALAERQQLIPELVRNGDEENPLKVRKYHQFKDHICALCLTLKLSCIVANVTST